jgi:phytoene dehydrogenase-like protein
MLRNRKRGDATVTLKNSNDTRAERSLGALGLPAPLSELARKHWDVIIVGAGHNGLTAAAYLARAGKSVLVLEARERIGGACTLEETWPGCRISPCAYLAGLLHPLVIEELDLVSEGFEWMPASSGFFIPFEDGTSLQLWSDKEKALEEIRKFSPKDVAGFEAYHDVKRRARNALRPKGHRDLWIGHAPSREQIEERLADDDEARRLLFDWSMIEFVERFFDDERLQTAYLGQGVIGTNASPHAKGTASIAYHHASGSMFGEPGEWGYVKGGMGMVSFLICDVAAKAGAVVATGIPVAKIIPSEGVELETGEKIFAPSVISNADPRVTLRLLGKAADPQWRTQVESIPIEGCTLKVNVVMKELPNFTSRPGTWEPHHLGQINTPLGKSEWHEAFLTSRAGKLPKRLWTELYFQTAYDSSVAPPDLHTMSIFAQYVPYHFHDGSWDDYREKAGDLAIDSIARFCSNLPEAIVHREVLGPPDIEKKVGLTGGHIFQGECLPEYMWDRRLTPKTPMPGVYLCGAGTYPGGSVIAINGRNAAMEILGDKR